MRDCGQLCGNVDNNVDRMWIDIPEQIFTFEMSRVSSTFEPESNAMMSDRVEPIVCRGFLTLYRTEKMNASGMILCDAGGCYKSQLQPNGEKHVTTGTDNPRVSLQTEGHGVHFRTFETELIQSSKVGKDGRTRLPFSIQTKSKPVSKMNRFVVYKITNTINQMFYIGSTSNFQIRKSEHLGQLRNGVHCNRRLQSDFKKFREPSFTFEIIHDGFINRQAMLLKEYDLILSTFDQNYNVDAVCPVIGLNKGKCITPFEPLNGDISHRTTQKNQRETLEKNRNKMTHPHLDKLIDRKKEREMMRGKSEEL